MSDSGEPDDLAAGRGRNRQQRIDAVKRWIEYVREHPPDVRGDQQNRLVDAQLESARQAGLDPEHYRRVNRADRE